MHALLDAFITKMLSRYSNQMSVMYIFLITKVQKLNFDKLCPFSRSYIETNNKRKLQQPLIVAYLKMTSGLLEMFFACIISVKAPVCLNFRSIFISFFSFYCILRHNDSPLVIT